MLIQEKTHVAIFLLLSVRAFSRSHACHESIQMSSRLSNQIAAGRGGAIAWFAEFFFLARREPLRAVVVTREIIAPLSCLLFSESYTMF